MFNIILNFQKLVITFLECLVSINKKQSYSLVRYKTNHIDKHCHTETITMFKIIVSRIELCVQLIEHFVCSVAASKIMAVMGGNQSRFCGNFL